MSSRTLNRAALVAVALALLAYAGSYLLRTVRGRYEPEMISNGVYYAWAPRGFVRDYRWNPFLVRFYYPLYHVDRRFWHTWAESFGNRYPINQVADKDIGELRRAWK